MSSITTVAPTGRIIDFCIAEPWDWEGIVYNCDNGTNSPSDYWSVCCDGDIVDVAHNLYNNPIPKFNMEDLICCRHIGKLAGGIHPLPTGPPWTCDLDAVGTPLASLAATNVKNAGEFVATYASADYEFGPSPTDMYWTERPQCLWVNTKLPQGMRQVTVDAPKIIPLSATSFVQGEAVTPVTASDFWPLATTSTTTPKATGAQSTDTSDTESILTGGHLSSTTTQAEPVKTTRKSGSLSNSFQRVSLCSVCLSLVTICLLSGLL